MTPFAQPVVGSGVEISGEVLSAALVRAGLRERSAPALKIERGWPLSKVPLVLRCAVPEVEGKKGRWWSFYFPDGDPLPYVCRLALKSRTAFFLEHLGAVAQPFPHDPLLSKAGCAVHKRTALTLVRSALAHSEEPWSSLTARILSYKPSRRLTLRYRLRSPRARERTFYAKLLCPEGAEAAVKHHLAISRGLQEVGRHHFSTARLAGYSADSGMVVWRRAPGRSLFDRLASKRIEEHVRGAAQSLANLHGSSVPWRRIHDRARELATVRSWIAAVEVVSRGARDDLREVLFRVGKSLENSDSAPGVPSHRDFYDRQILVDGNRLTLLDLELASLAEPELDVANFLAHLELRQLQGRLERSGAIAAAFVEEYESARGSLGDSRLRAYLAASFLRLACVYTLRQGSFALVGGLLHAAAEICERDRGPLRESA